MQLTINLYGTESDSDLRRLARAIEALQTAPPSSKVEVHFDATQATVALEKARAEAEQVVPTDDRVWMDVFETENESAPAGPVCVGVDMANDNGTDQAQLAPNEASAPPSAPANMDAKGLPWDERIHSSSRKFNADGTWRYRKNVSDDMKQAVEAELRALVYGATFDPPPALANYNDDPVPPVPTVPAPAPVVPPAPPAAPPAVPSAVARSYSDVVNLIMSRKVAPEVFVAILGSDLPTFANVCRADPNAATKAFNELDHASRT